MISPGLILKLILSKIVSASYLNDKLFISIVPKFPWYPLITVSTWGSSANKSRTRFPLAKVITRLCANEDKAKTGPNDAIKAIVLIKTPLNSIDPWRYK